MTDHLPDDPDHWPINPRDLLNVSANADRSEIRRAYTVLLRRFRPEKYPRQFQRIREALETLLEELKFADNNANPAADPSFQMSLPWQPSDRPGPHRPTATTGAGGSSHSPTQQVSAAANALWDEYTRHPTQQCVRRLFDLVQSHHKDVTIFLMGYWMAKFTPDLCGELQAIDWIRLGLQHIGTSEDLVALLIQEADEDRSLTNPESDDEFAALIRNPGLRSRYLLTRWTRLARFGAWKQLANEYSGEQRSLAFSHPDVWFHLSSRVFEISVFARSSHGTALATLSWAEMQSVASGPQHADQQDYADVLAMVASLFKSGYSSGDRQFDRLLIDASLLTPHDFRLRVMGIVATFVDNPQRLLALVTMLMHRFPESIWLLHHYSNARMSPPSDSALSPQSDPALSRAVEFFCARNRHLQYQELREELVEFCRTECIPVSAFFQLVQQLCHQKDMIGPFDQIGWLAEDLPLHLTCQWYHHFFRSCDLSLPVA
ncbi:MAG: J domain-containing protein [Planctomycetaceae bacterium]|nr:J domain-containing protein [Planctomycetaceae bacterium]